MKVVVAASSAASPSLASASAVEFRATRLLAGAVDFVVELLLVLGDGGERRLRRLGESLVVDVLLAERAVRFFLELAGIDGAVGHRRRRRRRQLRIRGRRGLGARRLLAGRRHFLRRRRLLDSGQRLVDAAGLTLDRAAKLLPDPGGAPFHVVHVFHGRRRGLFDRRQQGSARSLGVGRRRLGGGEFVDLGVVGERGPFVGRRRGGALRLLDALAGRLMLAHGAAAPAHPLGGRLGRLGAAVAGNLAELAFLLLLDGADVLLRRLGILLGVLLLLVDLLFLFLAGGFLLGCLLRHRLVAGLGGAGLARHAALRGRTGGSTGDGDRRRRRFG